MDKVQKIREEVARIQLYTQSEVLKQVLDYIDGVQKEPVSNPIDFEKELYKAFGQVKDFTLGMRIAKWFYDMGKNSQEPVSEDLWETSKQYALRQVLASTDTKMSEQAYLDLKLFSGLELAVAHKDGAQWQKEQMMANAIEGGCFSYKNGFVHISCDIDEHLTDIKIGDKVKVIVIKDD